MSRRTGHGLRQKDRRRWRTPALPRHPLALRARLTTFEASSGIVLEDITVSGAKLSGVDLPAEGTPIMISVPPFVIMAEVVWVGADHCGVRFDEPITHLEVIELRALASRMRSEGDP